MVARNRRLVNPQQGSVNRRVVGSSPTRGAHAKGPLRRAFCISRRARQASRATRLLPRFLVAQDSRLRPGGRIRDEPALEMPIVSDRRRDVAMAHLPPHVFDGEAKREPDGRGGVPELMRDEIDVRRPARSRAGRCSCSRRRFASSYPPAGAGKTSCRGRPRALRRSPPERASRSAAASAGPMSTRRPVSSPFVEPMSLPALPQAEPLARGPLRLRRRDAGPSLRRGSGSVRDA